MARTFTIAVALLAAALRLSAETVDPVDLIGMDPPAAFAALGAPREIFAWRGAEPAEDNVVFFYPDFSYLFWFGSRVWQVRYDSRHVGTVMGFAIGMGRGEAEAVTAGKGTLQESGGSLYLSVDTGRFPLRLRLALFDGRVSDIYVTRSDW